MENDKNNVDNKKSSSDLYDVNKYKREREKDSSKRRKDHDDARKLKDLERHICSMEDKMTSVTDKLRETFVKDFDISFNKALDLITHRVDVILKNAIPGLITTSVDPTKEDPVTNSSTLNASSIKVSKSRNFGPSDNNSNLDDNFQLVNNSKRKNVQVINSSSFASQENGNNIYSNSFAPLSIDDEDVSDPRDEIVTQQLNEENFPHIMPNNVQRGKKTQKKENPNTSTNATTAKSSPKKPKPIVAFSIDHKVFRSALRSKNLGDFRLHKNIDSPKTIIYPANRETREAALDFLNANHLNYFTYTPDEEKCSSLLIKGVSNSFNADDVLAEFERLGYSDKVATVTVLKGPNLEKFNYFVLRILPNIPVGEFMNIKLFLNSSVSIVKLNKSSSLQCYRCQEIGHVSNNCSVDPVCVKCAKKHLSNECPLPKSVSRDDLKCKFCSKPGHPSNYRGCPELKRVIRERAETRNKVNRPKPFVEPSLVKPNISFANMFNANKPGVASKSSGLDSIRSILNNAIPELFGVSYAELKSSFDKFLSVYYGNFDLETKKEAAMNFIITTNFNG